MRQAGRESPGVISILLINVKHSGNVHGALDVDAPNGAFVPGDSDVEMRAAHTNEVKLVAAAQAGDRRALDELVLTSLPLVYSIVGRALSGHPDVDDVVQDTMLRALRRLRTLRGAESYRSWLAAIAVRQVSTHLRRRHIAAQRTTDLDAAVEIPDADADFQDLTMLQVELSGQRRQVVRAGRWLDPDDQALLSLWWLEVAGQLTRGELAAALGVSIAHAGVRVQRMRHHLELSRSLVAALDAVPRCADLDAVAADWHGGPNPLWRKRLARHTRSCPVCAHAAGGMIATERLLVGFALLTVPMTLGSALLGKTAAVFSGGAGLTVKAGLLAQLTAATAAHPVVATVAVGALVVGAAVTTTNWPAPEQPSSAVAAAPSAPRAVSAPTRAPATTAPAVPHPSAPAAPAASPSTTGIRPFALGPLSLESANAPGQFVTIVDSLGVLAAPAATGDTPGRRRATFEVVPGLADANCFSLRGTDGGYVRHASWRVRLNAEEGTALYRGDATFCLRTGAAPGSVFLESSNYPGWFVRRLGGEVWVDQSDGTPQFRADSSFWPRPPLAG